MITGSDPSRWKNVHWVATGFAALAVILSAASSPFGPSTGPGELGDPVVTVVAKLAIHPRAEITAEQLSITTIRAGSLPEASFGNPDQVIGRIAISPIGAREPITNLKLAPPGPGWGLMVPKGYRAMTVNVDEVDVPGFIFPGSFVDVVALIVPSSRQGGAGRGSSSRIALQNIKVLASGRKIGRPENQRQPADVMIVTLQLTPQDAEKLAPAANEGKLKLVMRSSGVQ